MASATSYNICYCSESESGSSVNDSLDESNHNKPLHRRSIQTYEPSKEHGEDFEMKSPASVKDKLSKIRKKYSLDDGSDTQLEDSKLPNGHPAGSSSSISSLDVPLGVTSPKPSKKQKRKKKIGKNFYSLNDGSDTMQEDAGFSSTTTQELDQAWDVYQEPLYATGSDVADEERLDPSSLIGDWEGSMDEDATLIDPVTSKGEFYWSEESDTDDINTLIEDSRMQLKIISEVIKELESDYMSVSCSDYIESCATCKTNIGCLENLIAALNVSMGEQEEDNDYVNPLIELLSNWQKTLMQLEEIERPKQLGQKSKVKKRLKKKMFRKFSCDSRKESLDYERLRCFAQPVFGNRSGSLPEVEFIDSLDEVKDEDNNDDNNDNNNDKSFATDQKVEGGPQLMSVLFFGLIALILVIKIGYSCYADVDVFSFDVTFFINYLRENPPA